LLQFAAHAPLAGSSSISRAGATNDSRKLLLLHYTSQYQAAERCEAVVFGYSTS